MEIGKLLGGIITAVLIAVIIFYINEYWLYKPDVRITSFDMHRPAGDNRMEFVYMQGDRVGASITAANVGRATAEDCRIYWQSDGLGYGDALRSSNAFSLIPNEKKTEEGFETFIKDEWACPNSPGIIEAKAWVECENCNSEVKTDSISAGPLCGVVL